MSFVIVFFIQTALDSNITDLLKSAKSAVKSQLVPGGSKGCCFTLLSECLAHCLIIPQDEQLTLCSSQMSSVTSFECLWMLNSLLVQRRLFRGAPSLLYSYRYVRSEVRAAHWGILWARFNIQHLYFWFVLHAFIFSAVRGSASALIPAAAANLKQEVRHQNKIIWPTSRLTFCVHSLSFISWQCLSTTRCGGLRSSGSPWIRASGTAPSRTSLSADRRHGASSPTCLSTPGKHRLAFLKRPELQWWKLESTWGVGKLPSIIE